MNHAAAGPERMGLEGTTHSQKVIFESVTAAGLTGAQICR
jgi:hypothetical protein